MNFQQRKNNHHLECFFIKTIFGKSNEDLLVFSSIMKAPDKNEQHA